MRQRRGYGTVALFSASLLIIATGCTAPYTSTRTVNRQNIYRAELECCRDVYLSHDLTSESENRGLKRHYEEITIRIEPREVPEFEATVKKVDRPMGLRGRSLEIGTIEARCNESQSRIWFVDKDAGRVIATVDRVIGQTTGPDDEHPGWADPNGGTRLKPANELGARHPPTIVGRFPPVES